MVQHALRESLVPVMVGFSLWAGLTAVGWLVRADDLWPVQRSWFADIWFAFPLDLMCGPSLPRPLSSILHPSSFVLCPSVVRPSYRLAADYRNLLGAQSRDLCSGWSTWETGDPDGW